VRTVGKSLARWGFTAQKPELCGNLGDGLKAAYRGG
jgi:hypothetical protein